MRVAFLDKVSLDLGQTDTYARRSCEWVPGSDGTDHRDGTLSIQVQKGKRAGSKVDSDAYAVEHHGGGLFLLVKLTGRNAGEVYGVSLHPDHTLSGCTCDAGRFKVGNCKHRDSCKALLERGEFDETPIDMGDF